MGSDSEEKTQDSKSYYHNNLKLQDNVLENEFLYYKNITINHLKVSGNTAHNNFPFLLEIYDSDLRDYAQTDGDDIAFYYSAEKLNHEFANYDFTYNNTHVHLIAWIKIPVLSCNSDTIIQMYFGNPTMTSQENSTGAWDKNYSGVWHLDEDPSTSIIDSTIYRNNGTSYGNMNSNNIVPGAVNKGLNFTGTGKYAYFDNDLSLLITQHLTLEIWYNPQIPLTSTRHLLGKGTDWRILQEIYDGTRDQIAFAHGGVVSLFSTVNRNGWTQIVVTYDVALNNSTMYINGIQSGTTNFNIINLPTSSNNLYISDPQYGGASYLDEIRVTNTTRSASWIKTTYDNQKNPLNFINITPMYKISTEDLKIYFFDYSKIITINHTLVNGTGYHKDFPILIDILDKDLHQFAQQDGRDIAFFNGTNLLDFEIEYYNHTFLPTHARLVAWIRIPYLSTSENTIIYMCFGNSSIISQQNNLNVWDLNYTGVWHFNEDPNDVIQDSSIYHNDGKSFGSMTLNNSVEGEIGRGMKFDGQNDYINVGNYSSLDFSISDDLTLETWILPIENSTNQEIISKSDTGLPSYTLSFSKGQYSATGGIGSGFQSINSTYLNKWQQIIVVIDGGIGNGSLYINGKLDNTKDFQYLASQQDIDLLFGCRWNNQPNTFHFFNGSLDEIRISNIVRSSDWIITQFNNQFYKDNFYNLGALRTAPWDFQLNSTATNPDIDGFFTLNWNISIGADNYSIYWDYSWIDDYYGYLTLLDSGLTNNSRSIQFSNGTYYFITISYNETGSHLSNCIKVVISLTPCAFTIDCNASNPDTDGIFTLNWTNSIWSINYSIYYFNKSFNIIHENLTLVSCGLTNNSYLIKLHSGIYYFRVLAINNAGVNLSTNEIMVHIYLPPSNFSVITNLESLKEDGSILITWTISVDALNYSIFQDNKFISGFNKNLTLVEDGITENSYRVYFTQSGTYYFLIIAFNDVGNYSSACLTLNVVLSNPNKHEANDNNTVNNYPIIQNILVFVLILGLAIVAGVSYIKLKGKNVKDTRKEISLKIVLSHIESIFKSSIQTSGPETINKTKEIINPIPEIDKEIVRLKQNVIELFLNGAYLESIKETKKQIQFLKDTHKEEESLFFSNFYIKLNDLINEREENISLLDNAKLNNNNEDVTLLYNKIIELSRELNDLEGIKFFEYEMEEFQRKNK